MSGSVVGDSIRNGTHYAVGVYYFKENVLYYGDSLGWPIPLQFRETFLSYLTLLRDRTTANNCHISAMHAEQDGSRPSSSAMHHCNPDCWVYYPLQDDGHICGVAAIFMLCLAAFGDSEFLALRGLPNVHKSHFRYVKNISQYSDFLRLTIIGWLMDFEVNLTTVRAQKSLLWNYNSERNEKKRFKSHFLNEAEERYRKVPTISTKKSRSSSGHEGLIHKHSGHKKGKVLPNMVPAKRADLSIGDPLPVSREKTTEINIDNEHLPSSNGKRDLVTPSKLSGLDEIPFSQHRMDPNFRIDSSERDDISVKVRSTDIESNNAMSPPPSQSASAQSPKPKPGIDPEPLAKKRPVPAPRPTRNEFKTVHVSRPVPPLRPPHRQRNVDEGRPIPVPRTLPARNNVNEPVSVSANNPETLPTQASDYCEPVNDSHPETLPTQASDYYEPATDSLDPRVVMKENEHVSDSCQEPPCENLEMQARTERKLVSEPIKHSITGTIFDKNCDLNAESFIIRCQGESKFCTEDKNDFHCSLCSRTSFHESVIRRHIEQSHLSSNRTVTFENLQILPCKKIHTEKNFSNSSIFHYHCPVCDKFVQQKCYFLNHLANHISQTPEHTSNQQLGTSAASTTDLEEVPAQSHVIREARLPKIKRAVAKRVPCNICGLELNANNMKRHCLIKHNLDPTYNAVCCDAGEGIYMVRKSKRGGIGYPLHVQKVVNSLDDKVVACEEESCRNEMQIASRSKMKGRECYHLMQVNNAYFPTEVELDEECLQEICDSGKYKVLTTETAEKCVEKKCESLFYKAPSVVEWMDGNYIHLSVFDGQYLHFPVRSRVVVTYRKDDGSLKCRCRHNRSLCIHKAMAIWFLHQGKLISEEDNLHFDEDLVMDDAFDQGINEAVGNEAHEALNTIIYPPQSQDTLKEMIAYWLREKKIPFPPPLQFRSLQESQIPRSFKPIEMFCSQCNSPLSGPYRITHSARILTLQGFVEGVETFFKMCNRCEVYFRYQEYEHGIHNFNDILLLGLDVCIFWRECQKNHQAVGTICNIIESIWKFKVDSRSVFNAYLHFEALSDRSYEFNCVECGYFPPIMIADVNRKVVFKYRAVEEENLLDDEMENVDPDLVDSDDFWAKVLGGILSKGLNGRKIDDFFIEPRLSFWSPYIGPQSRISNLLVNSEHRKVNHDTGEIEIDCRELSEERLIETMFESKHCDLQKLARKVGVNCKGSKLDIINRVKEGLGTQNNKFNKMFKKMFGRSGGWLTVACQHGVIYAVKFLLRAESPRDYIDILRGLKHQPNVFVNDMAHMVAAHGNRHHADIFRPFEGRVAEANPENVASASDGSFQVSFPWLNNLRPFSEIVPANDCHPVTGSDVRMALFDRFHEGNTGSEEEALRRIACVKELSGQLNSQVAEQIHGSFNNKKHYMNQMTPTNHIFVFRSGIDLRNEEMNKKYIEKEEGLTSMFINFDELGRSVFGHSRATRVEGEVDGNEKGGIDMQIPSKIQVDLSSKDEQQSPFIECYMSATDSENDDSYLVESPRHVASIDPLLSDRFDIGDERSNIHVASLTNEDVIQDCANSNEDIGNEFALGLSPSTPSYSSSSSLSPSPSSQVAFASGRCRQTTANIPSSNNVGIPSARSSITSDDEIYPRLTSQVESMPFPSLPDDQVQGVSTTTSVREEQSYNNVFSDTIARNNEGFPHDDDWVGNLSLSYYEKAVIECGGALTIPILDASMKVIKNEYNAFDGLVSIKEAESYRGTDQQFIQIIPLKRKSGLPRHWGTLSNILSPTGHVSLYDGILRQHIEASEVRYHNTLPDYSSRFLNKRIEEFSIDIADVASALKNSYSGVASIFYALCLARGIDPQTVIFRYRSLQIKLIACLQCQSFKEVKFDGSPRIHNDTRFILKVKLFCHCWMPDLGTKMVLCSHCEKWFHQGCESGDFESVTWKCQRCLFSETHSLLGEGYASCSELPQGTGKLKKPTEEVYEVYTSKKMKAITATIIQRKRKSTKEQTSGTLKKIRRKKIRKNRLFKEMLQDISPPIANKGDSDTST
eukprot:Seg2997.2 transcript_id=Seg2997.2/GoldUCD/mRNA.D3Y31 product="HMG domain-containing protein 3" protein_id=Seg2997.2/GoldUCD/D3Y31